MKPALSPMSNHVRPFATVLLAAWVCPALLLAQPTVPPAPGASASASAGAKTPAMEEAQRRYTRALELFNEGAHDAALLEFRRAYELAPSWRILFNIGQVNVQLNDYARALDAFSRYLKEGGPEIPPARAAEVQTQLERLKGKVASLEIISSVPDAEVTVDDVVVGKTPLDKPVMINIGRRKVTLAAAGRLPQTKVIEAAGGDKLQLRIDPVSTEVAPTATATATAAPTATVSVPERHIFWPGWVAVGVLGAGAAVTGVLSLGATSDHNDKLNQFGTPRADLDDSRSKARTLSIATDVLLGAALITGGVSLYLSLRTRPSSSASSASPSSLQLRLGASSVGLGGSF